jgi:hypothetical protein
MNKKAAIIVLGLILLFSILAILYTQQKQLSPQDPADTTFPENPITTNDEQGYGSDEGINQTDVEPVLDNTIVANFSFEDYSKTLTLYSDMFIGDQIKTEFTCRESFPKLYVDSFEYPYRFSVKLRSLTGNSLFEKSNLVPRQGEVLFDNEVTLPCVNLGEQYQLVVTSNNEEEVFNFTL